MVVALERVDRGATETSRILVAVSKTSDPTAGWWFTAINSKINIGGLNRRADYLGLGVDDKAIYITNNMFTFTSRGASFGGVRLWIINKTHSIPVGPHRSLFTIHMSEAVLLQRRSRPILARPATMGTFLVSYSGLSGGGIESVQIVRVDSPLTTPVFTQSSISLGDIDNTATPLPGAPQSGSANYRHQ